MSLLIIDRATVRRLLPFEVCTPLMRAAMIALSTGQTQQVLRQIIDLGGGRAFGVMPGAMAEVFGAKLISVFSANVAKGGQSHQGLLTLFEPETGAPVAVLHAGEVTAIRTAAASAAATDVLARHDAHRLALLGAGEQAYTHALAVAQVRPLSQIRIWARAAPKAEALAARLQAELGVAILTLARVEDAVRDADIVCTITGAHDPILRGGWVAQGAHINLVGSSRPGPREVDDDLVVRARIFADHREGVMAQGAEVLHALDAELITPDHVLGEIGDVMAGLKVGRQTHHDITVYKSLGSIVQDLASGWLVYNRALTENFGARVDF